jgi:hypothetical protein
MDDGSRGSRRIPQEPILRNRLPAFGREHFLDGDA